ncbi:putative ABC transporter ATP-binding protein [Lacticaseibacillus paracasei]|nr:putative ABC transporter ATP-binding protein [Lacticaseibacillus paracasei]
MLLIGLSVWYGSWLAFLPLACVFLIGFAMMFLGKKMSAQNKAHRCRLSADGWSLYE